MAVDSNPLAKLLGDFLLGYSKAKGEGLDQHPLIQTPVLQRLTAEYLARQPGQRAAPTQDIAMGALGDYWALAFRPDRLTLAFRDEWRQYLVLAVAYFIPFRRRQSTSGALPSRSAYPQSYGKLGDLLSDMDYLADVLAEETAYQYDSVRVAEFCQALVPNVADRDKGVKPATTVASSRSVAIAALAGSLLAYAERHIQAPPETDSLEAVGIAAPAGVVALPAQAPVPIALAAPPAPLAVMEAMVNDDRQLSALLSVLEHRLAYIEHANDSPTLAARGRGLAQQLAAIRQGVVVTSEPTTELTGPNIQLALRRVSAMTEDWRVGDQVLDLLAHSGMLERVGDRWVFAYPALELFFAAEHLADDREHWVSFEPRHHRLMRWTAAVLAHRADDRRNDQFCQDLGQTLRGWSPVALVDVADILSEFRHAHTPATLRFRDWLRTQLMELAEVASGWLRCRLWQCSQDLGIDLGAPTPDWSPEPMVPPATLDAERLATAVPEFLSQLGMSPSHASRSEWYEDRHAIQALLTRLKNGLDGSGQQTAAAWLRQSSLQTYVDLVVDGPRIWNTHRATALEIVAEVATNREHDEYARALARSILATDAHLLALVASDRVDRALLYTLELILDKRLFFSLQQGAWFVY